VFGEAFFDSDGVRLHYLDWGGSGRSIVLLAGLGGTAHIYRGLAPRLAQRFRVAGLTRRGHGRSDRPDNGYDIATLVDDIRRFMDALRIERATLAGHSWAGIEIPLFAVTYPERVAAVVYLDALHVLLEPEIDTANDPALRALEAQPGADDVASLDAYLSFVKRSRPDLAAIWCEAVESDRAEDARRLSRHGPAADIVSKMRDGLGPHRTPAYGAVRAAALALVPGGSTHPFLRPDESGELRDAANAYYRERYVPRARRRTALFREAVPSAVVVELDTSNHTVFVAKEDETLEAIFDFLGDEPGEVP
jgi:pimeloyl-ACP methyl ester carboxylesterase